MDFDYVNSGFFDSTFVKLGDEEKITGVFRGNPRVFKIHWIEGKSAECVDHCAHCKAGNKPKFRFKINLIVQDDQGNYAAKIFSGGRRLYQALAELNKDEFDLEKTWVTIRRNGEGLKTTYSVMPTKNHLVTSGQMQAIENTILLPLDISFTD